MLRVLAPLLLILACLGGAAPAAAFPDGAPWEATRGEVCHACHFDRPVAEGSTALAVEGLPIALRPNREYPLTTRIDASAMRRAGLFLTANRKTGREGTSVSQSLESS